MKQETIVNKFCTLSGKLKLVAEGKKYILVDRVRVWAEMRSIDNGKYSHKEAEFAQSICEAVNNYKALKESNQELVEALRGLMVYLEWREDYIVEDAEEEGNVNAYSQAKDLMTKLLKQNPDQ